MSDRPEPTEQELQERCDSALNSIGSALADIRGCTGAILDGTYLAGALYELAALRRQLAATYLEVEAFALSAMGDKEVTVEPFGTFKARRKTKRTGWRWRPTPDAPGLIDVIVARAADDWGGEPPAVFAAHVADELADCIGFSSGKVTGLRARNIAPDLFCDETPDGWSVELPKASKDEDEAA